MKRLYSRQGQEAVRLATHYPRRNLDESDEGGMGLLCGWHADWRCCGALRRARRWGHEMSDWEEISDQRVAELRAISRHCQRPPQMHPYRRLMARLKASLRLWLREVPSQSKR